MAKEKETAKPAAKKYSDKDIAAFVEELETGDETAAQPVDDDADESAAPEPTAVPAKTGKKIKVEAVSDEPSAHEDMPASLSSALKPSSRKEMGKMTKAKRSFPWTPVISIVALLAAASIGGWFFFNRTNKFTNDHVQLQFKPVTSVTSGGDTTIVVEYQNLESVDLTQAELNVVYPEGFTYSSSTPNATNEFNNSFSLGTIRSGQAGQVSIIGSLLGGVNEQADFSATLTYRPSNFNSDFQQQATTTVTISSSTLQLTIDGPTQLAPGADGTWTVKYTNTSDRDLTGVSVVAAYPDALTLTSTKPVTADHKTWSIPTLKKGANGTITITGTVNGTIGDTVLLKVSAGLTSAGSSTRLQDEQSLLVLLIKTGVAVQVAVNGSTDPVTISPGDTLNYSLQILNTSDAELSQVTITAALDGSALDTATLSNDSHGTLSGTTLTWTSAEIAGLSAFKPGQAVTLSFSIGTKAILPMQADADKDRHVTLSVDVASSGAASTNTNATGTKTTQPTTVVVTKIATIFGLTAEARYYDDKSVAIGSGPIPPKVGSTTTYRIILKVTNTTSDASAVTVSAQLPSSVLWTGQNLARDAGTLAFDTATRTVAWTINTVPAGTGSRLPALTARFDVSITPTADQVDTVPLLVQMPTVAATDDYSKSSLTATAATLTTDLPTDPAAAHQGTVVAQ